VAYAVTAGDKKEAVSGFSAMQKNLDQAVNKGLIHKNQAARKKSRLSTQIKAL
jgi:small subunit ribosomal protein S20